MLKIFADDVPRSLTLTLCNRHGIDKGLILNHSNSSCRRSEEASPKG